MLRSLFFIFLFLFLGDFFIYLTNIPIPGNITGMVFIFIALKLKIIQLETVKPAADKLLKYMVLFFVPFGVGLVLYFDVIVANWLSILIAVGVSSILTLYVTAIIQQKLEKK